MEMLAAQAAHQQNNSIMGDEESVISDKRLTEEEKRGMLQRTLHMAASNGDVDRVQRLVQGRAKECIDINAADEEGSAPLIYASCFVSVDGHSKKRSTHPWAGSPRGCVRAAQSGSASQPTGPESMDSIDVGHDE